MAFDPPLSSAKKDILGKNDIVLLVDSFYARVREDAMLGPVFEKRITDDADWPRHLGNMYNFWDGVLFGGGEYQGRPFPKHLGLGIGPAHFDRWIELFYTTVDGLFVGSKAEEVKMRAGKIRMIFEGKLKFMEG